MSLEAMALQAAKVVGAQPSIKVLIEGDQAVTYGYVMSAMDRLKMQGSKT